MSRGWGSVIGAGVVLLWSAAPTIPARAEGGISLYDARAVGAVIDFNFFAPQAVFPFPFQGGVLESTSVATSSPRGFGFAGMAPVPAATSIGILVPQKDPFTGGDVPPEVQEAFKSIDYTQLPNGCQALFPPVKEGYDEVNCGGPNQDNPALAFTYAGFNGYSRASGNLDDPMATRTLSRSRADDIGLPSLQATIRQAWTEAVTRVNEHGLPQAESFAYLDSIKLAGSLVKINGISSHTIVATDGTPAGTAAATFLTVREASVAGIPVVIGPDGISVDKNQVPQTSLKPLSDQVAAALAGARGLSVRLVGAPAPHVQGNEVIAESSSLEISYASEAPTPMQVAYRVGFTKGVVNAVPAVASPDVDRGTALPAVPTSQPPAQPAEPESSTDRGSAAPAASDVADTGGTAVDAAVGSSADAGAANLGSGVAPSSARADGLAQPADGATTSLAASSRNSLGDLRRLAPAVGLETLPSRGLRRVYSGMMLLGLGVAVLARLPRQSWLHPRRVAAG